MKKLKTHHAILAVKAEPIPEEELAKAKAKRAKKDKRYAEDKADLIWLGCLLLIGALLYRYWVIVAVVIGLCYWVVQSTKVKRKREWRYTKSGKLKYKKVKR